MAIMIILSREQQWPLPVAISRFGSNSLYGITAFLSYANKFAHFEAIFTARLFILRPFAIFIILL
jgi:hypothetical protein